MMMAAFDVERLVFGINALSGRMRGAAATKIKLHAEINRDIAALILENAFGDQQRCLLEPNYR
jgi:hypothetical protein